MPRWALGQCHMKLSAVMRLLRREMRHPGDVTSIGGTEGGEPGRSRPHGQDEEQANRMADTLMQTMAVIVPPA